MICAANIGGSFAKAAKLLQELAGLDVTAKEVQRKSEKVGKELVEIREKQCHKFLQGEEIETPPNPPDLIVVSADGGRVQTINDDPQKKWKENKVGVVYRAIARPEEPGKKYRGPRPLVTTYVATMGSWDKMGDYLSQEAAQRGYHKANEKVFIGDAGAGVKSIWQRCFYDAEYIVDWAHAVEHIHSCAVAAFGNSCRTGEWYEHQKQSLWEGKVHLVIGAIRKESKRVGKPRKNSGENDPRVILARNLGYFTENQQHMGYPRYRKKGWPIGSGVVESGVKVLGKRVKGTEKHWSIPGAEAIMTVMTLLMGEDNRWDRFWNSHDFSTRSRKIAA